MTTSNQLPVTEIFFDTIQGEGATVGRLSSFLRLSGCIRHCTWCDSTFAWKPEVLETSKMPCDDIIDQLDRAHARNVVITGGEPLLHQGKRSFTYLIYRLLHAGFSIEIETEGSIMLEPWLYEAAKAHDVRFNVSPKLQHAGMGDLLEEYAKPQPVFFDFPVTVDPHVHRFLDKIEIDSDLCDGQSPLQRFLLTRKAIFKFVVRNEDDVLEAINMVEQATQLNITEVARHMYLMAEGKTKLEQLENMGKVLGLSLKYGFNFSPRMHILQWDTKRGV